MPRLRFLGLAIGLLAGCGGILDAPAAAPRVPEGTLVVENGNPGLTDLRVILNGHEYRVSGLRPNEVRTLDVSAARAQSPTPP